MLFSSTTRHQAPCKTKDLIWCLPASDSAVAALTLPELPRGLLFKGIEIRCASVLLPPNE